jgi:Mg2+/Co2+ transporter CorC
VGGLVMAALGRIPAPGDEVAMAGAKLRVERVDGRRVACVRLTQARARGSGAEDRMNV